MDIIPPVPAKEISLLMHVSEFSRPRKAKGCCKAMIFETTGLRRVKSEQLVRDVKWRKVYNYLVEETTKWSNKLEEIEKGFAEIKRRQDLSSLRTKLCVAGLPSEWKTDHIKKNTFLCTITSTRSRSLPYLDDPNDDDDDDDDDDEQHEEGPEHEHEHEYEYEYEDEDDWKQLIDYEYEDEDEDDWKQLIDYFRLRSFWLQVEVNYLEPYLRCLQEMYAREAKLPHYRLIRVGRPEEEHVRAKLRDCAGTRQH